MLDRWVFESKTKSFLVQNKYCSNALSKTRVLITKPTSWLEFDLIKRSKRRVHAKIKNYFYIFFLEFSDHKFSFIYTIMNCLTTMKISIFSAFTTTRLKNPVNYFIPASRFWNKNLFISIISYYPPPPYVSK